MKIDLSNQVAVVTGATGDLGRVIAETLAKCGADVAIHYHSNERKAEQISKNIAAYGRKAYAIQADITDYASIQQMQKIIEEKLGTPSIIVNSAVIQYGWNSILEQSIHDFESQFRSCVMHNVYMVKAFGPAMIERRWGRIIGINTECILQCYPSQGAYVSGKGGMDALLKTLSKELGSYGITVNQIAPGWMLSDRDREGKTADQAIQEVSAAYSAMLPLKHRGEDSDIANVVAFLASDLARFITGVLIPIHGGGPCLPSWIQ